MRIILVVILLAINIGAQTDTTDWKVLDAIEIALKYMEEPVTEYDLLYRSPEMVLQQALDRLKQKEKDIEYLKAIRREYIDRLRAQAKKSK